jgi:transcriptional regulator with XRE-family HTH domain
MSLQKDIDNFIKKRGLTQREFACMTGLSVAGVNRILNGNRTDLKASTLVKLYGVVYQNYEIANKVLDHVENV